MNDAPNAGHGMPRKECRKSGSLLRDPQGRADMFKLAIEYDLKAKEAEVNEHETLVEKELRKLAGLAAPASDAVDGSSIGT